jgi:hypothetical protein
VGARESEWGNRRGSWVCFYRARKGGGATTEQQCPLMAMADRRSSKHSRGGRLIEVADGIEGGGMNGGFY